MKIKILDICELHRIRWETYIHSVMLAEALSELGVLVIGSLHTPSLSSVSTHHQVWRECRPFTLISSVLSSSLPIIVNVTYYLEPMLQSIPMQLLGAENNPITVVNVNKRERDSGRVPSLTSREVAMPLQPQVPEQLSVNSIATNPQQALAPQATHSCYICHHYTLHEDVRDEAHLLHVPNNHKTRVVHTKMPMLMLFLLYFKFQYNSKKKKKNASPS